MSGIIRAYFQLEAKPWLDDMDEPLLLGFIFDEKLARRIQYLVRQIIKMDIQGISDWCHGHTDWYEARYTKKGKPYIGPSIVVQQEALNVHRDYIYFSCSRKHSVEYYSDRINLDEFLPLFGLDVPRKKS